MNFLNHARYNEAITKLSIPAKLPFWHASSPFLLAHPTGWAFVRTARVSKLTLTMGAKIISFSGADSFATTSNCRFCAAPLVHTFCNLGVTPPSNSYLKSTSQKEFFFPLHAYVCEHCLLVQIGQFQTPDEIFSEYAYFSSISESWIEHGRQYTQKICERFRLNEAHFVVEIASNDGYLLQHFQAKGIPILGIEPARNVAQLAIAKGIPTLIQFFSQRVADQLAQEKKADLIIGNNVLAHIPDLNDFIAALKTFLGVKGVMTFEFPHLLQLILHNQFDTIYHEHFSYFSLIVVEKIFRHHGLELFDVEELDTHGGSLRIYVQHLRGKHLISDQLEALKKREYQFGCSRIETYTTYSKRVEQYKEKLFSFLQILKQEQKTIAGYGAPAKGNTLLNYCGITTDLLPFTVDKNPHKQGRFLPGTHIPIYDPSKIDECKPDYVLILPWNLKNEVSQQMGHIRQWGGKFITPIPEIEIF